MYIVLHMYIVVLIFPMSPVWTQVLFPSPFSCMYSPKLYPPHSDANPINPPFSQNKTVISCMYASMSTLSTSGKPKNVMTLIVLVLLSTQGNLEIDLNCIQALNPTMANQWQFKLCITVVVSICMYVYEPSCCISCTWWLYI